MKVIYHTETNQICDYPRIDSDPVVGLADGYLILNKIESAAPSYDHTTQSISSSWIIDSDLLEYRQSWQVINLPFAPNWDGLYTNLMVSQAYQYFVGAGLSNPKISSELGKIIDAIQYGIFLSSSPSALPAFQSSLNLFLFVLDEENSPLPTALRTEVESILLANHFTTITLP